MRKIFELCHIDGTITSTTTLGQSHHHHHHVVPLARISLTLPRHFLPIVHRLRQVFKDTFRILTTAVCMFELVVQLLHGHMWGSIGVHHLWSRLCFSSSVDLVIMAMKWHSTSARYLGQEPHHQILFRIIRRTLFLVGVLFLCCWYCKLYLIFVSFFFSMSSKILTIVFSTVSWSAYCFPLGLSWKSIVRFYIIPDHWPNESGVRQWSGRPGFNPRPSHTKDLKNDTWFHLA